VRRRLFALLLCAAAVLASGCAGVTVSSISPAEYLAERRGDVLTSGRLSGSAQEVLRVIGVEAATCREKADGCRRELAASAGITDEQRLSALSEIWLESALAAERAAGASASDEAALDAWLETARHAYAYLFFTARRPGERAFEDRQTQVRDYYNYAVQQTMVRLFRRYRSAQMPPRAALAGIGAWRIASRTEDLRLPQGAALPQELIAASSLRFSGLRNTYRRDGFGAELVAVMEAPGSTAPGSAGRQGTQDAGDANEADDAPFDETRFPAVTALLRFEGRNLREVLSSRDLEVVMYDPYRSAQVRLAGETVPLAANFTAGYGLWLARSGFAVQSLRTLFGLSEGIVRPRIQLMQPYDPDRHTIVMLHGLASSPEAWINVANEVLGDEELRKHYQIWQVYYPTNAPLPLNQRAIRQALQRTLAHFDPAGTAVASRGMVLVGHSMGGVLSRLMVSESGDRLWALLPDAGIPDAPRPGLRRGLAPYLSFEPLPQVDRAIFIAAPHRGTPFAENRIARRIANLITLPLSMLGELADLTGMLGPSALPGSAQAPLRIPNSIDNLSDRDPFVRAAAGLPISPRVRYHSIIGNHEPELPLEASSDGIVPYASAHLEGASSELVIRSTHSVQEHPLAILEIRRILREQLQAAPAAPAVPTSAPAR
jgi:pimeloyl-ACP methyl ester carboxylesterase